VPSDDQFLDDTPRVPANTELPVSVPAAPDAIETPEQAPEHDVDGIPSTLSRVEVESTVRGFFSGDTAVEAKDLVRMIRSFLNNGQEGTA
jgi:hypothetical protein